MNGVVLQLVLLWVNMSVCALNVWMALRTISREDAIREHYESLMKIGPGMVYGRNGSMYSDYDEELMNVPNDITTPNDRE